MERGGSSSVAAVGCAGVLPGRRGPAAVRAHPGQGHLRHGPRGVRRTRTRLHGRHTLGTPRDSAER